MTRLTFFRPADVRAALAQRNADAQRLIPRRAPQLTAQEAAAFIQAAEATKRGLASALAEAVVTAHKR